MSLPTINCTGASSHRTRLVYYDETLKWLSVRQKWRAAPLAKNGVPSIEEADAECRRKTAASQGVPERNLTQQFREGVTDSSTPDRKEAAKFTVFNSLIAQQHEQAAAKHVGDRSKLFESVMRIAHQGVSIGKIANSFDNFFDRTFCLRCSFH